MKKVVIIILAFFLLLLAVAALLPVIFKDEIKAKVDQELAKSVNAQVNFDADNFSVSLFRKFPNITASLKDFSVVGNAPFAGDTLAAAESFQITLNIWSVLFGDQMKISSIDMVKPNILIKVLEDGTANYDVAIEDTTAVAAVDTTSTGFSIGIESWEITDGTIVYDDRSIPFYVSLENVQHSGGGDFTQDIIDMTTRTTAEKVKLRFDGTEYVTDKRLEADVAMNLNLPESKYTFQENNIRVNDFAFGFEGFLAMPGEDIGMDITFGAKDNTFKSLLSLVPGMYRDDFDKVQTEGDLDFNGFVKGIYSESDSTMPAFNLALKVNNAMFKYPDLPTAVENINVDMLVASEDGNMDNLLLDVKQFALDMGKNPINGRVKVAGLGPMDVDADVKAKVNLADLNAMVPMEGLAMRGLFDLNLQANGVYDTLAARFPKINALMSLKDGYMKSSEYPFAMENINLVSKVINETENMANTVILVENMSMLLDGERMDANLRLENLDNYTWDAEVKGAIDLDKITKIYPLEDMTLSGRIVADIQTKGDMAALDAEQYDQLPTSGTMRVENFRYQSPDLPQDFQIANAAMSFNPQRMVLSSFSGNLGKTDLNLDGYVSNYLGFALKENETIKGEMNFRSKLVDLNQFMTDEETPVADTASAPMEVIEIPKNIDFVLHTNIDQVLYDDLTLKNTKGDVTVKEGVANLNNLRFNALDGLFTFNGSYNTQNIAQPTFDLGIDIEQLSIGEAFRSFVTVQKLAPIAEHVSGKFNTDINLAGVIGADMMPELTTLTGGGIVKIIQASLEDSKIISGITSLTKLNNTDEVTLKDLIMKVKVQDGRLHVEPFDINIGTYTANIAGSNGIDGSLAYNVKMDIPAGAVGSAVNNALASLTGKQPTGDASTIKLAFGVGGTYDSPKIGLASSDVEGGAAQPIGETVKEAAKEKVDEQLNKAKEEANKAREEAEAKAREEVERRKKEAEEKAQAEIEKEKKRLEEEAKNKLKDLFKKE